MNDTPDIRPAAGPGSPELSRRSFLTALAGSATLIGCGGGDSLLLDAGGGDARLSATVIAPTTVSGPGSYPITPGNPNDGVLIVPANASPTAALPLVVYLHGAGQGAVSAATIMEPHAQSRGFILLVPGARGLTWDVISYRYSYDITFLDAALKWTFGQRLIDPTRVLLQGVSDGGSYALGLGLANGQLFTRVAANSPGYIPRADSPSSTAKSRFFLSHGRSDPILNIDNASRKIVPALRGRGYDVTYVEFDGGHEVPPAILTQSLDWMLT